jgi:NADP-dependent 3-hydroxy acid dehydrogenase YdfG
MTVFITGATAGFGLATAKRFLQDGAKVIGTGRRANRLDALSSELGARFLPLAFDVGNRKQVEHAIAKLPADFAAVDVLVNNAGGALGLDPAQLGRHDRQQHQRACVLHAPAAAWDDRAWPRAYRESRLRCRGIPLSWR